MAIAVISGYALSLEIVTNPWQCKYNMCRNVGCWVTSGATTIIVPFKSVFTNKWPTPLMTPLHCTVKSVAAYTHRQDSTYGDKI